MRPILKARVVIVSLLPIPVFALGEYAYARIVDKNIVPIIVGNEANFLKLSCVNEDFNSVLQQYHFR